MGRGALTTPALPQLGVLSPRDEGIFQKQGRGISNSRDACVCTYLIHTLQQPLEKLFLQKDYYDFLTVSAFTKTICRNVFDLFRCSSSSKDFFSSLFYLNYVYCLCICMSVCVCVIRQVMTGKPWLLCTSDPSKSM